MSRGALDGLADRIAGAAAALRRGEVIAYPTETFYGLGALAADGAAVERLLRAKSRPDGKPLPLLGADLAQLEAVARFSPLALRLAAAFWPGPLTLVLPARPGLHPALTGGGGTVGLRVTSGEVAAALARAAGGALVATSANPAGQPPRPPRRGWTRRCGPGSTWCSTPGPRRAGPPARWWRSRRVGWCCSAPGRWGWSGSGRRPGSSRGEPGPWPGWPVGPPGSLAPARGVI